MQYQPASAGNVITPADFRKAVVAAVAKCEGKKLQEKAVEKTKEVAKDAAKKVVEEGLKALKK